MSDERLPHPATNADTYAYATVVELRRLNANMERLTQAFQSALAPLPELQGNEVELKEPAKKPLHRDSKKKAE